MNKVEILKDIPEELPPDPGEVRFSKGLTAAENAPAGKVQFPRGGIVKPPRRFTKVVLPQPDGPMNETNSPRRMESETPSTARISSLPLV